MKGAKYFVVIVILASSIDLIVKNFPIKTELCKTYIDGLIAEKGKENISWKDFDNFLYTDIGSGQYVYEYDMVGGSHLYLCGSELSIPPTSIYIVDVDGKTIQIK